MRILGVDPGSRVTGFGIIDYHPTRPTLVAGGCIRTRDDPMPARLYDIHNGLVELIRQHQPDTLSIELCFVSHNPNTAIKLGQARGMALLAAQSHGLTIAEYAPRAVKQSIVGYGHADKAQMQAMVQQLLKLGTLPSQDAADALALALCHAFRHRP